MPLEKHGNILVSIYFSSESSEEFSVICLITFFQFICILLKTLADNSFYPLFLSLLRIEPSDITTKQV